jgi:hypothetical protein
MSALNNASGRPVSRSEAMEHVGLLRNRWDLVRIAIVVLGTQAVIRLMIMMRQWNY